jgi:quercetin dioxygenase-like cupin family protein
MIRSAIFEGQRAKMLDIMGPLVDLSTRNGDDFVVIRSIAPSGTVVPLHSHSERETMVIVEGKFTAWLEGSWQTYGPGEIIEIASNEPHALRNDGPDEVSLVLVTTSRMANFLGTVSASQDNADVSPDRLAHFVRTAVAYGFWNGSIEDQAAIGIELPNGKSGV